MAIRRITIEGLRGFSNKTIIDFAIPDNNNLGSGLTVLVGPNNSGKSSVIEAVHLISRGSNVIPQNMRNQKNNGKILVELETSNYNTYSIESTDNMGAFAKKKFNGVEVSNFNTDLNTYILSSKRGFSSNFYNNGYYTRDGYKGNVNDSDYRKENVSNNEFGGRLLNVFRDKQSFDKCLNKVLNPLPTWTIEANDNNLFLEFSFDNIRHSSKGAGDGFINIFNIIDSLYDSKEDNIILIDEPEISLHPDLQRKLFDLLAEYSKDKQIIICTHSPYFVDWNLFCKKSKIIRFKKDLNKINIYQLSEKTKRDMNCILNDYQKPHILSLNANEIFFLNDNIILTEGQDDVICYKKIFEQYNFKINASFFGWGAGGASNIQFILELLNDMGYEKVYVILDNDKKDSISYLSEKFSNYKFFAIDAKDVRDKKRDRGIDSLIKKIDCLEVDENAKNKVIGIINYNFKNVDGLVKNMTSCEVKSQYKMCVDLLINDIKTYFAEKTNMDKSNISIPKTIINEESSDEEKQSEMAKNIFLKSNIIKKCNYANMKYKNIHFSSGDGVIISCKKIKKNNFYIIYEKFDGIGDEYIIICSYNFVVNIDTQKIKYKSKKIIKNTLPTNGLNKFVEIIRNI